MRFNIARLEILWLCSVGKYETSLESAYLEYVSEYDTEVSQYIEQSFLE